MTYFEVDCKTENKFVAEFVLENFCCTSCTNYAYFCNIRLKLLLIIIIFDYYYHFKAKKLFISINYSNYK